MLDPTTMLVGTSLPRQSGKLTTVCRRQGSDGREAVRNGQLLRVDNSAFAQNVSVSAIA